MTEDLFVTRPRRSVLFVSGLKLGDFDAAKASGADIVCIDLEDAVPAVPPKDSIPGDWTRFVLPPARPSTL
jgi:hypothetical protein